jgi:hypothetical protein
MRRTIPQNRTLAPAQSHTLSGCEDSHGDAAGSFAGIRVEVAEYDDGAYLPGDLVDDRLAYWSYEGGRLVCWPAPQRTFIPHAPGPVVGAGPAYNPGGAR